MKKYFILLIMLLLLSGCGATNDTLTIDGMYLGKKVPTDRDHLVMDGDCTYMDGYVGYDVDGDDRVEYMVVHRTENSDGEELCGLSNMNLYYHGEHLDTTEKVIACFGENYVPDNEQSYETFTFEDDELIVEISLHNGEFNGITVRAR